MKKKFFVNPKDKKDWEEFTKNLEGVYDKDGSKNTKSDISNRTKKLDLHGLSLADANQSVEKFISESYKNGYKKILIITGKGARSNIYSDPYRSEKMGVLKYSVPEYIKNNKDLMQFIKKISLAEKEDGGEGAICIFLKQKKL